MSRSQRTPAPSQPPPPLSIEDSLRTWCMAALDAASDRVLSLERLRDICRGHAAAEGEENVEPIDVEQVAHALAGEADWEIVCRPRRAPTRSG